MPVLLFTEHVACASNFKVEHGDFKTAAELRKFGECGQPLERDIGYDFVFFISKIRARHTIASAHPAF